MCQYHCPSAGCAMQLWFVSAHELFANIVSLKPKNPVLHAPSLFKLALFLGVKTWKPIIIKEFNETEC